MRIRIILPLSVALVGLFGLVFVLFATLQHQSQARADHFHHCMATGCSRNIPNSDHHAQCFQCLSPSHDLNICDSPPYIPTV